MGSIKVFISSAIDELEYERETAVKVIRGLNLTPSVFEGFRAMSKTLEDAYLDEVQDCDIFVLILWKTLRRAVEREYWEAVRRDKPILIFVKMLKDAEERELKLSRFLGLVKDQEKNATSTRADAALIPFFRHYRSLVDLEAGLRDGIVAEIYRKLSADVIATRTRQDMYELGISIISTARKRLYITQRTPTLLLGARPYAGPEQERINYDVQFEKALRAWIDTAVRDVEREGLYLYDVLGTKAEIQAQGLQEVFENNLRDLKQLETRTGHRFRITSTPSRYSGPIAVGDSWFAIWVVGGDNAVAVSKVSEKVSDEFVNILRALGSRITTVDQLLAEMDH